MDIFEYVDDNTLVFTESLKENAQDTVEQELKSSLENWFYDNGLVMNVSKTQLI